MAHLAHPRHLLIGLALALPLALTACGSSTQHVSTPASTPVVLSLDDNADHSTVHAAVGATVQVTLHSTFWSPLTSSAPQVLAPTGATTAPAPASCHPGGGCGTVLTTFQARTAGSAQLTATRTSCGEAKPCAPGQQSYTVTVQVG
ncbi:hypothetical protein [Kitasatospora sp. GAS204B]|uniref:hypothetical protein n=1 Tax=unclassified Kitasatospora TaxID=2633591 RepID=UPI00247675A0|nr:hypothetical protein [Kitasatospora sp. GAS204B]MDH6121251.1 hypothetical protein [Kitasatospora sp. GAS204B]